MSGNEHVQVDGIGGNSGHRTADLINCSSNHADSCSVFFFYFRDLARPDVLVALLCHLELRRQIDPALESSNPFTAHLRHLFVPDAASSRHPLNIPSPETSSI